MAISSRSVKDSATAKRTDSNLAIAKLRAKAKGFLMNSDLSSRTARATGILNLMAISSRKVKAKATAMRSARVTEIERLKD
jgi:hypothetical protein